MARATLPMSRATWNRSTGKPSAGSTTARPKWLPLFDEVERRHLFALGAPCAAGGFVQLLRCQGLQQGDRRRLAAIPLQIHPGNKDAPYAFYLIALSYYEQISDVQRDQKITDQALTALNEINRRFPNSDYAADARLKIDLVRDHLAGKEMEIGRHYERSGKWIAAQIRFQNVVDNYETTSHAPEALYPADRDQPCAGHRRSGEIRRGAGRELSGQRVVRQDLRPRAEARPGRQRGLILNRCRRTRPLRARRSAARRGSRRSRTRLRPSFLAR